MHRHPLLRSRRDQLPHSGTYLELIVRASGAIEARAWRSAFMKIALPAAARYRRADCFTHSCSAWNGSGSPPEQVGSTNTATSIQTTAASGLNVIAAPIA